MLEAVARTIPQIYAFCRNAYTCQSSIMFLNHEITSSTGAQQGDPLSSLLFSLTIQPILERLSSELNVGYLDDLTIGGTIGDVCADIEFIHTEARHIGLDLNTSKCEVITSQHIDLTLYPVLNGFIQVDARDACLLGSPLMADRCLDDKLGEKCRELELMVTRIAQIDSHYALTILRNSLGVPKLLHMLRTSRCFDSSRLVEFDGILKSGLETILNVELSGSQWEQACLPIREGGLGIRTAVSLAPSAFLASAVSSCELQQDILPMISSLTDFDLSDNLIYWSNMNSAQPLVGDDARKQRSWDNVYIQLTKTRLLTNCTTDIDRARLLAAYDAHSGDWLHALPLPNCGLFLDNEVVRISVALRLGAILCLPHDCPCGHAVDARGLHCFSCLKITGKTTRHNLLNDIVWRTMTRAKIQSIKEPLSLENSGRKPDGASLIPWQRGRCVTWDVTVADTYAKSYIGQTSSCVGAAAERAASRKVEKYNFLRDTYIFIPLACETTGVWCTEGAEFLNELGRRTSIITGDKHETAYLFQRLSVAIQRGNAACFYNCFSNFDNLCE